MDSKRSPLRHFMVALALAWLPGAASLAGDNTVSPHVVLSGYDPVAYFTEKRPVEGKSAINYDWDDGRYRFASTKHRELFISSPDRFVPQFAGFCAGGVSRGMKVKADPTVWRIVDGKLYVFAGELGTEEDYAKAVAVAKIKWKDVK
ncbi:MAG: YHS domain-containing (seleno)protein [Caldimonas sp.]